MMDTTDILLIRCPNNDCQKQFKMRRPAKPGIYNITCPYDKYTFRLNIPASMAVQEGQAQQHSSQQPSPQQPSQHQQFQAKAQTQQPDNSAAQPIKVEGDYLVGKKYEIVCPHCHKAKMGYTPQAAGLKGFQCPVCKGPIHIEARQKTNPIDLGAKADFVKGRIHQMKRFSRGVFYPLPVNKKTIIGRDDPSCPSDIGICGDSHISRRSLAIDVSEGSKGYTFKLTVLKATNPVLHNGQQLIAGESIYLNFGDSLTLGKTKLIFEKDV